MRKQREQQFTIIKLLNNKLMLPKPLVIKRRIKEERKVKRLLPLLLQLRRR